jgi:methyltransferase
MGEGAWLIAFLAVQRLVELGFAQANTARLRAKGGVEFGAAHYPLIIALHGSWMFCLLALGHDHEIVPFWLVVFALLQVSRLWVIASLGRRWTHASSFCRALRQLHVGRIVGSSIRTI